MSTHLVSRSAGTLAASQQEARLALLRFQRAGIALDPNYQNHIRAYMQLRSGISRVALEKIIAYLRGALQTVATGTSNSLAVWAVLV